MKQTPQRTDKIDFRRGISTLDKKWQLWIVLVVQPLFPEFALPYFYAPFCCQKVVVATLRHSKEQTKLILGEEFQRSTKIPAMGHTLRISHCGYFLLAEEITA